MKNKILWILIFVLVFSIIPGISSKNSSQIGLFKGEKSEIYSKGVVIKAENLEINGEYALCISYKISGSIINGKYEYVQFRPFIANKTVEYLEFKIYGDFNKTDFFIELWSYSIEFHKKDQYYSQIRFDLRTGSAPGFELIILILSFGLISRRKTNV